MTAIELQRARSGRRQRGVEGHVIVVTRCYGKIKRVAAVDGTSCIYEVPEFVIGVPPYDMCSAVNHLIESLERNGYLVTYMFPRSLLISWDLEARRETPRHPVVGAHPPPGSATTTAADHPAVAIHRPISDFKPSQRFVLRL